MLWEKMVRAKKGKNPRVWTKSFAASLAQELIRKRKYDDPTVASLVKASGFFVPKSIVSMVGGMRNKMGIPPVFGHSGTGARSNPAAVKRAKQLIKKNLPPSKIAKILKSEGHGLSIQTVQAIKGAQAAKMLEKQKQVETLIEAIAGQLRATREGRQALEKHFH